MTRYEVIILVQEADGPDENGNCSLHTIKRKVLQVSDTVHACDVLVDSIGEYVTWLNR